MVKTYIITALQQTEYCSEQSIKVGQYGVITALNRYRSEVELMRLGAVADGESSSEIALQVLHFLDVLQQFSIDCLLGGLQLLSPLALLGFALFGLLQPVLRGVLELVLGEASGLLEEGIVDVDVHAIEGHLGGGRECVGRVDSAERDSVDRVGSGDQQIARGESLEHHHSSSPMNAGQQDHN